MTRNRIKLLNEWKTNSLLTYHIDRVEGSFKVDKVMHPSLEFLRTCWIKKWENGAQLKQAQPEIISKIITISIGGSFVNYLNYPILIQEEKELEEFYYPLNGVLSNIYLELSHTLFSFYNSLEHLKTRC